MPLVLAERVDDDTVVRALTRAQHAAALTFLVATALSLVAIQAALPALSLWWAVLVLVPPAALLIVRLRWTSTPGADVLTGAYVAACALAIFVLELGRHELLVGELAGERLWLLGVKVAIVLCGSVSTGVRAGITWTAIGLATAELASLGAGLVTGGPYEFSVPTLFVALVVMLIRPLVVLVSPKLRVALPQLRKASLDNDAAEKRAQLEQRAAALVHDTVLDQLEGIATATKGPLEAGLRERLTRDAEYFTGDGWLHHADELDQQSTAQWQRSPLFRAIQDSRSLGLRVETTGDLGALLQLTAHTERELALALAQCLRNVLKHAGTDSAEVAVYETGSEVCVMVVDTGHGFDESETGDDRLGLRNSVRRRIEGVGGRVQVWSTLGQGTSIMLRVPAAATTVRDETQRLAGQP